MDHQNIPEHDHYHLLDPEGGFTLNRYNSEADALSRATVYQSYESNNEKFWRIIGVSELCRCTHEHNN